MSVVDFWLTEALAHLIREVRLLAGDASSGAVGSSGA